MAVDSKLLYLSILLLGVAVATLVFRTRYAAVKNIRGPASPSWLMGHERLFTLSFEVGAVEDPWFNEYGDVFRTAGIFGIDVLHVADPKALQYIMHTSGYNFPKPYDRLAITRRVFGKGIISVGGTVHQRHRKVMNPAFSGQQLRTFLPLFQEAGTRLVQKWTHNLDEATDSHIDVSPGLNQTALDAIGKSAFDYDFDAISENANELCDAIRYLLADTSFPTSRKLIYNRLWRHLPTPITALLEAIPTKEVRRWNNYTSLTAKITKDLLAKKQADGVTTEAKDILSVLARANMAETGKHKLDEAEVLAQASTFTFAGHETTATTLTWLLYELASHTADQAKIRAEIAETRARVGDAPFTSNDYDSMPFLNATIKETLRLYPILNQLVREAGRDDALPLAQALTGVNGQQITSIPIRRGQQIVIDICRYNRLTSVWGADADKWNPERFIDIEKKQVVLGVYANLMSFSAGTQGCIGWRFAIMELQTIVAAVLETFEFALPVGGLDVVRTNAGLTTPTLRGEMHMGAQMPLIVARVVA